jgi:GPH family glycoside/pentoside/hexuronide:cation symporter
MASENPDLRSNSYREAPENISNQAQSPLTVKEKIGYGLGDTASNLYWKLFENFQLYFYTDVFGISAAAAATMFFVTKLWDAINDPIVGFLADRTRTAWGSFRPYLIWGSIPFAVTGILTFYTPDLEPRGKLIYAYITYTLVFMAYTVVNIPYGALLGVISSNSIERTSASTYRFVLAFLGGLAVQKFTEPLVALFGGSEVRMIDGVEKMVVLDKQTGFFWTACCYAVAAMILFWITFAFTKERTAPENTRNNRALDDVGDLLRNRAWIVLLFLGLFQILAGWTRGSAVAYYFTYYVGQSFGNFLAIATVASICGMVVTKPLTAWLGKRTLMIALHMGVALLTACFFFLPADQVALIYALNILIAFISGPIPVLLFSMYADAADYGEWKNHRRATGLVFAAATFSHKLGGALGSAIPGWMLAAYSFQAPVDGKDQAQSAETVFGIVLMMSLIPAAFMFLGAVSLFFYNLSDAFLSNIERELFQRKQALSNSSRSNS